MASASMEKLSSLDMDLMARMRVLEGALGVPRWAFSRDRRSIGEAMRSLPREYPEIDSDWFAIKDFGLQDAVLQGARKVLKNETGSDTAEEIAQNLAAGLSPTGKQKEDVYGWIGRKHGPKILSGRLSPKGIRSQLYMAAERRAVDVFRKKQTEKKRREQHSPTLVDTGTQPGQVGADVVLERSPMEALLSLLSSPAGRKVQNWIYRTLKSKASPTQLAVFEAWADNPSATNAQLGNSPQVIAEKGGPISGQMAGRHLKNVVEIAKDEMQRNPQVTDWIDRYMDLQQLGYGGGALRYASADKIVVTMYSDKAMFHMTRSGTVVGGTAELKADGHLHIFRGTNTKLADGQMVHTNKLPILTRDDYRNIRDQILAKKVACRFLS